MSADRPLSRRARFDLHTHTTRSDGKLDTDALIAAAAGAGIDVLAITDHDIAPVAAAGWQAVGPRWLRVVHAAEVTGLHHDTEQHLLVYFPAEMPAAFRAFLAGRAAARAERYATAVERLALSGLAPPSDEARRGERALTRMHLAQALVEAGHAPNIDAAFASWLRDGAVPRVDLPLTEAIAIARDAGALTSWAHPRLPEAEAWAGELGAAGLHALETHRPSLGRFGREQLFQVARRHGLLTTGGSDYHGWRKGAVGAFTFPMREARPFARALGLAGP